MANLSRQAMSLVGALEVLHGARTDEVVITSMGTAREWPRMSQHPLDFHFVPSAMGGAIPLGLGLALAQPRREVIVLTGDGSLLMSLGALATVVAADATNLTVILVDNACYEVTGGQRTAGAIAGVDYAAVATACGWRNVAEYDDLENWREGAAATLASRGPRFIVLRVRRVADYKLEIPSPIAQRVADFRAALAEYAAHAESS
jgi:thiamine pyrophosphate-dependent acetolactate synthase large subunit-like protein